VSWSTFEHQADVGLLVDAVDGPGLFADAGVAYFGLVCDIRSVQEREEYELARQADTVEELLVDWLNELVFLVEGRRVVCSRIDVPEWSETSFRALLHGEAADPERHELRSFVKAATYHGLSVVHDNAGWHARVILDV
jgi:SHS2 domain-containing protein